MTRLLCFHYTEINTNNIKTVGVARQQLHFLCGDKAQGFLNIGEAKESLLLTEGYVLRGDYLLANLCMTGLALSYISPLSPEVLEDLFFSGTFSSRSIFVTLPSKH